MTRHSPTLHVFVPAALVSMMACGSPPEAPRARTGGTEAVDRATAGSISGTVRFSGMVPAPDLLRMSADPACVAAAGPSAASDAVLVDDSGGLQNAFVWVKAGLDPKYGFPVPDTAVVLDQSGCRYVPRVIGIRAGQVLEILNSDDTLHNVHAMPNQNVEFNEGQPVRGMRLTRTFTIPEVMVRFTCNVHNWMTAHVGVVDHPFFDVTSADGSFEIAGVPPGTYTVEVWHERLGRLTQQVTVAPREQAAASFTFSG